jgi:hypothetical protein
MRTSVESEDVPAAAFSTSANRLDGQQSRYRVCMPAPCPSRIIVDHHSQD